jgi:hypothetical protein
VRGFRTSSSIGTSTENPNLTQFLASGNVRVGRDRSTSAGTWFQDPRSFRGLTQRAHFRNDSLPFLQELTGFASTSP